MQTDNGFEFINRFSNTKHNISTLFESTASSLGTHHKRIRPSTPRHNGKVERSHYENQNTSTSYEYSLLLADFGRQLTIHQSPTWGLCVLSTGSLSQKLASFINTSCLTNLHRRITMETDGRSFLCPCTLTTPADERVIEALIRCMRETFANPSAAYSAAEQARKAQCVARQTVACLLGCDQSEAFFTSGVTEGNSRPCRRRAESIRCFGHRARLRAGSRQSLCS